MILLYPALLAMGAGAFLHAAGLPVHAAVIWGAGGAYVGYLIARF